MRGERKNRLGFLLAVAGTVGMVVIVAVGEDRVGVGDSCNERIPRGICCRQCWR